MYGLDVNFPENFVPSVAPPFDIAIAIPESDVIRKILIQNPSLSDSDIRKNLEAYFADFNTAVVIDFQRLENNKIIAMAAPIEKINALVARVPATMTLRAIDNESYAIARGVKKTGATSNDDFGFYYLENQKIKLSVFKNNHLIFYDEFDHGEPFPTFENTDMISIDDKPSLLTLGLALRDKTDWNLLPKPAETLLSLHRRGFVFLVRTVLYGAIFFLAIYCALSLLVFSQQKYNQLLEKDYESHWAETSTLQSQKTQIQAMQAKMLAIQTLKKQQTPPLTLLRSLKNAMPDGVFLTQLSLQNNHIQITGRAVTQEQIDPLMKNLKNISIMTNSTLNSTQPDASEPPYHFTFMISAEMGEEK